MRYHDITHLRESDLNETLVNEAFMDSIRKAIGGKAKEQVGNVTNMVSAMDVLYRVIANPSYLESTTFELKRAIKARLKSLPEGRFKEAMVSAFPQGRGMRDFLKGVLLISTINAVLAARGTIRDQALDAVANSVLNLENIVGQLVNVGAPGLGPALKSLGIANTVLFSVLADINRKIKSSVRT